MSKNALAQVLYRDGFEQRHVVVPGTQKYYTYNKVKRFMDVICCLIGVLLAMPILIITSIAIKLDSKGPIIFKQDRVGLHGKIISIYKFRSMIVGSDNGQWAKEGDPRVTRVGRMIRKTRIDEIPQLFNVLEGDLSLIGPRPEVPKLTTKFQDEIPRFVERLRVMPGITGWAQVNGGYDVTPKEKLKYDLEYIKKRSLWMDVKILIKTVKVVLTGSGAR
ncbi:MAG: exopolysaccharide biosynthesis polyprenyl glycosylphosphotransferase [Firmicutes bacterium]|nr:exopolysaccharide biosynthesis polyprenyl glycosylphosphotransferase [Bacillota bacterium]